MQRELALRFEEIESNREEELSKVKSRFGFLQKKSFIFSLSIKANLSCTASQIKGFSFFSRYIQLFNEKVEELGETREMYGRCSEDLVKAKREITDLQYREEELQVIDRLTE